MADAGGRGGSLREAPLQPTHPKPHSLKGKGTSEEFFSSSEVGFFGRWAAEEQELVRGMHELQLLPWKIMTNGNVFNLTYNQAADKFKCY